MKNQYVLPNECKKCGATFDLWYELIESEERLTNEEIREKLGQKLAQSLCWGCKKQVLRNLRPETKDRQEESNESLEDFFLELDYE